MNEMYILFALFLAGFSSKMLDGFTVRKTKDYAFLAISYILLLAGIYLSFSYVPELLVAILVAVFAAGKLDNPALILAGVLALFVFIYFAFAGTLLHIPLLLLFTIGAFLDEKNIIKHRLFLPATAIISYFLEKKQQYFLGVVAFDAGYIAAGYVKPSLLRAIS